MPPHMGNQGDFVLDLEFTPDGNRLTTAGARWNPTQFSRLIHLFTRLWTTRVCEPDAVLNCIGRFFPSGSKQTFSVSPLIS